MLATHFPRLLLFDRQHSYIYISVHIIVLYVSFILLLGRTREQANVPTTQLNHRLKCFSSLRIFNAKLYRPFLFAVTPLSENSFLLLSVLPAFMLLS